MKFKATLSDRALSALEKEWLPALERFGKTFQLLLTPDDLYLLQTGLDTGGPFIAARWAASAAWAPGSLRLAARHADTVAFRLEGPALRRGLRGALALGADALELRLTQRAVGGGSGGGGGESPPQPFLGLRSRGGPAALAHDVPISRPYPPSELDALVAARDAAPLCDFYVDAAGVAGRAAAALDRLAALAPGGEAEVEASPSGRLALRARGVGVAAGLALAGLPVLPPAARVEEEEEGGGGGGGGGAGVSAAAALPPPGGGGRARGRAAGSPATAVVRARDLERALAAAVALRPARALLGIGPADAPFVHLMLAFRAEDCAGGGVDEGVDLVVRLPVCEAEE